MDDLWPDDLINRAEQKRTPLSILKEQAALLGQKTANRIEGRVIDPGKWSRQDRDQYPFQYRFLVTAPVLENYSFGVFSVYYGIDFYPLLLEIGRDIYEEIREALEVVPTVVGSQSEFSVGSEDQFLELLKMIFGSNKVRKVVAALLSQIEE